MAGQLKDRWKELWQRLETASVPQVAFEELVQAYSSPDRFYHNLTHIEACLSIFDKTKSQAVRLEEVELAIWFHDVIYDTRGKENEQKSAAWARNVISQAGLGKEVAARVSKAILATRHQVPVWDPDAQLMADVDLSILGGAAGTFWRYEENIRKEYAWVPQSLFRERRTEILRGFLSRPFIYYHEWYREALEKKARENLQRAITNLSNG